MNKDQAIGALIFLASIAGIILYGWLIFVVNPTLVLQLTAFIAVALVLAILAWIGYVMATTPPPPPLEPEPATPPSPGPETTPTGAEKRTSPEQATKT